MSWLGAFTVTARNSTFCYQLFVFDDGLVCVRGSIPRALPGAMTPALPGAVLGVLPILVTNGNTGTLVGNLAGGKVGSAIDAALNPDQLSKFAAKVNALGANASSKLVSKVLPRSILTPLDDVERGRIAGHEFTIITRRRRLFTGFTRCLGGRISNDDLVAADRLLACALGSRWLGAITKEAFEQEKNTKWSHK